MKRTGARGQSLVETAAIVPIVLIMLTGLYAACRTAILASRAQSAAQTEVLRAGRGQSGIENRLAAAVLPGEHGASVRRETGRNARVLPAPFPALAGRSSGVVSVNKILTETGAIGRVPPLQLVRRSELSADCWGGNSISARNLRRMIRARVALGAIR